MSTITKKIKILMPAAEIAPFAKAGGLADVVGSLSPALEKLGCDVRLVMPLYGSVDRKKYKLKQIYSRLEVPSGAGFISVNIWETNLPKSKVPIYFIEAPKYFEKKEVYSAQNNSERFLFFSLASLYITPIIKFKPDVVHCHDSHVALIPDMLKATNYQFLKGIKTLFTIHNFSYQGKSEVEVLSTGNLSKGSLKTLSKDAQDGDINFMVQGVLSADLINTVSKSYAKEITTPSYGAGLDNIIRKRIKSLFGILNGINIDFFNPATDKFIKKNYSSKSIDKKIINKLALQKGLGLKQNKSIALVGMTSRLVWQKGIDLINNDFGKFNCQFVFLGTGHKKYEDQLRGLEKKYPKKISSNITFNVKLAQQIYAGSDIFLMPSRFEPCGLGQMISMRYGTIPVVRKTGGLKDTVDNKVGFTFKKFSSLTFKKSLSKALKVYYRRPKKWRQMQINAMNKDFSWDKSANQYLRLYHKLKSKS